MSDKPWDEQLSGFLKKTGEDLKRAGEEIRAEAQRLMDEVRDPEVQQKMRERFSQFGTWAKKTAEDAAGLLDTAVQRAESAFANATERVSSMTGNEAAAPAPRRKSAGKKKGAATRGAKVAKSAKPGKAKGARKAAGRKKGRS